MKDFRELQKNVLIWAEEKGILKHATPLAQAEKTIEEAEEIREAIMNNDKAEIIDGIGDTIVTLIIQAELNKVDPMQCLEKAYNVIAKRTGKMLDGKFVKDK